MKVMAMQPRSACPLCSIRVSRSGCFLARSLPSGRAQAPAPARSVYLVMHSVNRGAAAVAQGQPQSEFDSVAAKKIALCGRVPLTVL